jgi:hypothetical protein
VPIAGVLLVATLALGLHVNLSASVPRGLPGGRRKADSRGVADGLREPAERGGRTRRGYLGPGPCAGGVQSVRKPVVAVAGCVTEVGRDPVTSTIGGAPERHHQRQSARASSGYSARGGEQLGRRYREPSRRLSLRARSRPVVMC